MSDIAYEIEIDAELSAEESIVGILSVPSLPDQYAGEYVVSPSTEVQVLETDGLIMIDDVTIGAVSQGSAATPETTITVTPSISVDSDGVITAAISASEQITPNVAEGYVSEGTAGTVMVAGSGTKQLDTMAAQEVTPGESQQILSTEGKYMTGDITVNAIPEGYKDMSGDLAWMGADTEYVDELYTQTITLADTNFASWTPSTTASAIQAMDSVATFVADMTAYDYIIRWTLEADIVYQEGATLKAATVKDVSQVYQYIFRRPSNRANLIAENFNYNACMTMASAYYADYYNSSGAEVMAYTASYGIYQTVQAATFSSTTAASPTVTVKRPILYARCNSTYWATARAAEVDQDESTVTLKADLFRIPSSGILRRMYETLADVYNGD